MQPLVSRTLFAHQNQSLLQLLIQQHQRSERTAQITVTSCDDLIDRKLILIKIKVGALAWHTNNIQAET